MEDIKNIAFQPIAVTYLMIMPLNFKIAWNAITISHAIQNVFPPKFRSSVFG